MSENVRLIDANVLIEKLRKIKTIYGVPITMHDEQVIHWVIGHINEQPTAYDVEKVVEQLEELKNELREKYLLGKGNPTLLDGRIRGTEDAIDIVRIGGKE